MSENFIYYKIENQSAQDHIRSLGIMLFSKGILFVADERSGEVKKFAKSQEIEEAISDINSVIIEDNLSEEKENLYLRFIENHPEAALENSRLLHESDFDLTVSSQLDEFNLDGLELSEISENTETKSGDMTFDEIIKDHQEKNNETSYVQEKNDEPSEHLQSEEIGEDWSAFDISEALAEDFDLNENKKGKEENLDEICLKIIPIEMQSGVDKNQASRDLLKNILKFVIFQINSGKNYSSLPESFQAENGSVEEDVVLDIIKHIKTGINLENSDLDYDQKYAIVLRNWLAKAIRSISSVEDENVSESAHDEIVPGFSKYNKIDAKNNIVEDFNTIENYMQKYVDEKNSLNQSINPDLSESKDDQNSSIIEEIKINLNTEEVPENLEIEKNDYVLANPLEPVEIDEKDSATEIEESKPAFSDHQADLEKEISNLLSPETEKYSDLEDLQREIERRERETNELREILNKKVSVRTRTQKLKEALENALMNISEENYKEISSKIISDIENIEKNN